MADRSDASPAISLESNPDPPMPTPPEYIPGRVVVTRDPDRKYRSKFEPVAKANSDRPGKRPGKPATQPAHRTEWVVHHVSRGVING